MTLTEDQYRAILHGVDAGIEYLVVDKTNWIAVAQYQTCQVVFLHNGKHYRFEVVRFGEYGQYDYEILDTEADEVMEMEVTVSKWFVRE